jgi:hypothetical protein
MTKIQSKKIADLGRHGFGQEYWDANYSTPGEMDCIGNVKEHVTYMKSFFALDYIDVSSVIDVGFGLGHLFQETLKEFVPYRAEGLEPSKHAFDQVVARKIAPVESTKLKLSNIDALTWCKQQKETSKRFDLGLCTSVLQYMSTEDIKILMESLSHRVKYLYLTVPTDKELVYQKESLEFCDEYAIARSRETYQKLIRPHFTFISSRILESKVLFDEDSTLFTDYLFRF